MTGPLQSHQVWNIIGRDSEQDITSEDEERKRFVDLHYDRFTYYPFHERPRHERDYVRREV